MSDKRFTPDAEATADKIARAARLASSAFSQLSLSKTEGDELCNAELSGARAGDGKGESPRPA